jgi:sporulation protein YlmC with PRC-barrel domain
MHIELGAHVWTHEGHEAGKVKQLIVDPSQQTLDAFVAHTQWMGQDLIVPFRDVERVDADDTIHLTITDEQFRALPPYVDTEFVSGGSSYGTAYGYGGGMRRIDMAPGGGSFGSQFDYSSGPLIGMTDLSSSVVTTQSSLSETEFGIAKGTKVISADGHHIGTVHEVGVTDEGKVRDFEVTSGHILKRVQLIPVTYVEKADADAVYLRITAAEVQELERTGPSEEEQP